MMLREFLHYGGDHFSESGKYPLVVELNDFVYPSILELLSIQDGVGALIIIWESF